MTKNKTAYDAAKALVGRPRWQPFGIMAQMLASIYLLLDVFHHAGPEGGWAVIFSSFDEATATVVMAMLSTISFFIAGILPIQHFLALRRLVREIDEERTRNNISSQ